MTRRIIPMIIDSMDVESITAQPSAERVGRARVHAALGDATRLGIVDLVQHDDVSPQDLARRLRVAPNLLAHHLRILEAAGIVRRVVSEGDRRRSYVQLVGGAVDSLSGRGQMIVVPRVLFVCTRNSARSILAAALWMRASPVPVASAGTDPAPEVHPAAIRSAMRHGLIPSADLRVPSSPLGRPKHVRDVAQPGDLVVSTCDEAREMLVRGAPPSLHWSVADPVRVGTAAAFDKAVADLSWRVARLVGVVAAT